MPRLREESLGFWESRFLLAGLLISEGVQVFGGLGFFARFTGLRELLRFQRRKF